MAVIRVGLVGLGEVAQSIHLPVLADQRDRWVIAGIHDVSPSLVSLVTSEYPTAKAFESAEALIASPDIDAVFVLSSDDTHSRFVRAAIAANKHILLEKPACLTVREIDELLALSKDYGKTIFVGYMRRYAPAYLAAREELPAHGDITHVRIFDLISEGRHFLKKSQNVLYPTDINPATLARGAKERDVLIREVVGQDASADLVRAYRGLTALSSHHISAMRGLLGEPKRVVAAHHTNGGANTSVTFDYGHFACLYDAVVDDLGLFDAMIEVRSNTRRVRIIYDTPYIRSLATRLEVTEAGPLGPATKAFGPLYGDAFSNELEIFHRHIMEGTKPLTDLADSRADLALMAAIIGKMRESGGN
ncbi:Gfo/Idh/MocA family oxidoreductase [Mesorhizobium sp. M4B.F.Ca.ET.089.01.1.1]|uniref:Gfo/Idh/MocA family protein n=1 Tax=Mesorhizobium sp. M4B.F.Ca.ET.089.01.1.1 TaxID=2496662 RepID=UPI000FE43628|nr:Gfo/Idh/MocA family oxidoreductase [Mesorhizobium sp. M4B.F.Ca.ET.089.01.1.1]RWX68374.1 Gfo/Idh/MocA family oxidoreductase [Mesorhizobium sp. M4B.F.Ca.ET.089.01.1.1]